MPTTDRRVSAPLLSIAIACIGFRGSSLRIDWRSCPAATDIIGGDPGFRPRAHAAERHAHESRPGPARSTAERVLSNAPEDRPAQGRPRSACLARDCTAKILVLCGLNLLKSYDRCRRVEPRPILLDLGLGVLGHVSTQPVEIGLRTTFASATSASSGQLSTRAAASRALPWRACPGERALPDRPAHRDVVVAVTFSIALSSALE